jgi:TRAP-type uncharacterized transport system substrate-binding protein
MTMRRLLRHIEIAALALLSLTAAARAQDTQYDPGKVSEGLKAIFQYGTGSSGPRDKLNANTVTLISGTIGGTYVQFGADLASVLDNGDNLRVLPIVGRGSVQSVADILYLRGIDLGIVRADTLDYLKKMGTRKISRDNSLTSPNSTMRRCTSLPRNRSAI